MAEMFKKVMSVGTKSKPTEQKTSDNKTEQQDPRPEPEKQVETTKQVEEKTDAESTWFGFNMKAVTSGLAMVRERVEESTKEIIDATIVASKTAGQTLSTAGQTLTEAGQNVAKTLYSTMDETPEQQINEKEEPVANPAMFGIPIEKTLSDENGEIPLVVSETIKIIVMSNWYLEEGIFRLSCSHTGLHAIKRQYDLKQPVDYGSILDPHLPACTLKLFLRDLPEPIFTDDLLPALHKIPTISDQSEKLKTTKDLMQKLPDVNRKAIHEIFSLLKLVVDNQNVNKMSCSNLGIIFVPALGLNSGELFEYLLYNHDKIFEGETITSSCSEKFLKTKSVEVASAPPKQNPPQHNPSQHTAPPRSLPPDLPH